MKKYLRVISFVFTFLVLPQITLATDLVGLKAIPDPNKNQLVFSWDKATTDTLNQSDGYALQWSEKLSDMQNIKRARLFTSDITRSVRLPSFSRDHWYYFRIYTYEIDGRYKTLSNGSKILKWKMTSNYKTETAEIEASDPVIVDNPSSDDDDSTSSFDFGVIRVLSLDTFADFSWSRPSKMVQSDYDGFHITIAKKSDLTDIVKTIKTDRTKYKLRVKGLEPNTQYYVRGGFYKNLKAFGIGTNTKVKAFKTIAAIDRSISTRVTRNLKKLEKKSYYTVSVGENDDVITTTTPTKSKTVVNSKNSSSVKKRITEIKSEIRKLQAELARLEDTKTVKTIKTYTKKKSLRDRIREKLASKRK